MSQKVYFTTSLTPNIIMHVFSCLEIEGSFYNSDYGMKHHFTLADDDYANWKEQAKKCMTLGCNAELYAVLFQLPSYIPADNIDMVVDCYEKIIEAVEKGSIDSLITSYPEVFDYLEVYAPLTVFDGHFNRLNEHKEIIINIIRIFQNILRGLWDRFYKNHWENTVKKELEDQVKKLNVIISPINIISTWQKKLNLEFPYPEFTAILVEPTSTIATNLVAEKIIVASNQEDVMLYKILVHEIGRSFLLNTKLFEHEKLKIIAQSNLDRLSLIVDAACIFIKKQLYKTFKMRDDDIDPYITPEITELLKIFQVVWDASDDKDIYHAIAATYNKLAPVL